MSFYVELEKMIDSLRREDGTLPREKNHLKEGSDLLAYFLKITGTV